MTSFPVEDQRTILRTPLSVRVVQKQIAHDASRLVDATDEAENNIVRGELALLRVNLKSCLALAQRIQRRARMAKRALAAAERKCR